MQLNKGLVGLIVICLFMYYLPSKEKNFKTNAGSILYKESDIKNGEHFFEEGMVSLKEYNYTEAIQSFSSVTKSNSTSEIYEMAQSQLDKLQRKKNPTYQNQPNNTKAVLQSNRITTITESRTSNGCYYHGHPLIVGPRGGCYYINSHGNKTYVDRSYCRNCN